MLTVLMHSGFTISSGLLAAHKSHYHNSHLPLKCGASECKVQVKITVQVWGNHPAWLVTQTRVLMHFSEFFSYPNHELRPGFTAFTDIVWTKQHRTHTGTMDQLQQTFRGFHCLELFVQTHLWVRIAWFLIILALSNSTCNINLFAHLSK